MSKQKSEGRGSGCLITLCIMLVFLAAYSLVGWVTEKKAHQRNVVIQNTAKTVSAEDIAKETALRYMQEKYGVSCETVYAEGDTPPGCGGSSASIYVHMRMTEPSAGAQDTNVQAYLDRANSARRIGHTDTEFLVYTDASGGNVIGDQYMWYYVYPLVWEWIAQELSEWLPCEPHWSIANCCSAGTMTKKQNGETIGFRSLTFAPDFPIVQTAAELKTQFPNLKMSVIGCIPETLVPDFTQLTMDNKEGRLKAAYPFADFHMSIYKVPVTEWQTLSQTPAFRVDTLRDAREVCRVEYK